MMSKLKLSPFEKASLSSKVKEFASSGIRVLILASRSFTQAEYFEVSAKFKNTDLLNTMDEAVLYDEVERDLTVLGVVCVQDEVQENVVETIA